MYHIWLPRDWDGKVDNLESFKSKVCPNCKSAYWDTPRKHPKVSKPA